MKKIICLFVIIFFFFCQPNKLFASEIFLTSYDVTYFVLENGRTKASFNISLKNTTSNYYASSYKIELGLRNIRNVLAQDPQGQISPTVTMTEYGQTIDLTFKKKVIGLGNELLFNISFETDEIVNRRGNTWEVNIPGIANQNEFTNFDVHVRVPSSFGTPAYIKPIQENMSLDFSKEQLGKSGISIAFGKKQKYSFKLIYHLENPNLFPIKTEIAIPPTTNYQEIFIDSIIPKPLNVEEDKDGNWLASYVLSPSQKLDVQVNGGADVFLNPKKQALPTEDFQELLKERPYWQVSNEKIKQLATNLKTIDAIYKYVVNKLNYDFSRVTESKPRLGSLKALENPSSAVCLEFTDLFISLARAAGIPAREIDGYAITENPRQKPVLLVKDVLHAWPEFYDSDRETWIMVDPTWENTTNGIDYFNLLDFNHLSFVIKGQNSSYPVPPGGYKTKNEKNTKDVTVNFDQQEDKNQEKILDFSIYLPQQALSGLPINGSISIKNNGKTILDEQEVIIDSSILTPSKIILNYSKIPPMGFRKLSFSFNKTPFLTRRKAVVKIQVAEKSFQHEITISPFFISKEMAIGGGILIVSFSIVIFIIAKKPGRLPFFGQRE